MAAAAVMNPTSSMYSNAPPPAPYSSAWPPSHSLSGILSPQEPRRMADNKIEPPPSSHMSTPHRQSLPSIHEALNRPPKPSPYTSPVTAIPPQHQYPPPQGPLAPRPYAETKVYAAPPRNNSPSHPVHTQNPFSRGEAVAATFPENRHASVSSLQAAPAPPPNPYAPAPPPPPPRFDAPRYEPEIRAPERLPQNGYANHAPPSNYGYPSSGPPASDSGYASSQIGQHGSSQSQPRYFQREGRDSGDWGRSEHEGKTHPFATAMKRQLDIWDFENSLAAVNASATALREWSAHYGSIAQEQQRTTSIPERMPNTDDCNEMLNHTNKIVDALQWMKETIHQQQYAEMADRRMREQGGKDYDPDEMSIYGDDMKSQGFGGSESKKRRGRAAHPGRCHSCNRAETPEWRRGPDGARTLCNACGLHYAKLTRKNIMKQSQGSSSNGSQLRPKSMDEHSPR
ncbi:hypothetical protein BP5796_10886 [Coleophoma crateriformis]|uniref:GATA-type domain-containing protein n=1 Tax=Coleophoma crateriformis TaxID=565419 RepID=A0A3D8QM99_9HELO|nr:hypothetical protein BP5796_10886 [Coleophoma crateriformis]